MPLYITFLNDDTIEPITRRPHPSACPYPIKTFRSASIINRNSETDYFPLGRRNTALETIPVLFACHTLNDWQWCCGNIGSSTVFILLGIIDDQEIENNVYRIRLRSDLIVIIFEGHLLRFQRVQLLLLTS